MPEYAANCPYCNKRGTISLSKNPKHGELVSVECWNCGQGYLVEIVKVPCPYCGKYFNATRWDVRHKCYVCPYCGSTLSGGSRRHIARTISYKQDTNYVKLAEKKQVVTTKDVAPSSTCFIATAAYGTSIAPEIYFLRKWRDEALLPNIFGRGFISLYYKISPPIASFISKSESRRFIVRLLLKPIIEILKAKL